MTELKGWLLADSPDSRAQAALGHTYVGWLRFIHNPLAMIGFTIVAVLLLIALFAPVIAPEGITSGLTGEELKTIVSSLHHLSTGLVQMVKLMMFSAVLLLVAVLPYS